MAIKYVIRYVAGDGSVWDNRAAAQQRDGLHYEVETLLALYLKPPIAHSHERRRYSPDRLLTFKRELVALCRLYHSDEPIFKRPADEIHPFSYAGRFLSDTGGPLNKAWYRLMCIDKDGYEYQQPFFANNPDKWAGETIE